MAVTVVATPKVTLATFIDQLSELTGDQVSRARNAGIYTVQDLINAMCDPSNKRLLADGSSIIDLALMEYIDDDTSDRLEMVAMGFTPRPANLTALVGPAGTGANPTVVAGHGNTPVIPDTAGFFDGMAYVFTLGRRQPK